MLSERFYRDFFGLNKSSEKEIRINVKDIENKVFERVKADLNAEIEQLQNLKNVEVHRPKHISDVDNGDAKRILKGLQQKIIPIIREGKRKELHDKDLHMFVIDKMQYETFIDMILALDILRILFPDIANYDKIY
jgi:hypothetical protein